jgi:hypothetical protein
MHDAEVFEDVSLEGEKRNVEILVPYRNEKAIPDYLEDFIQNDPNFVPEIHKNNLEDAFMSILSTNNLVAQRDVGFKVGTFDRG